MTSEASSRRPPAQCTRVVGVAYELGESTCDYRELPGFHEAIGRFRMADDPKLWGWGTYRRTSRGASALAISAGQKTLASAGMVPDDIDAVILCAVSFPSRVEAHLAHSGDVLSALELSSKLCFGITLNRCATLVCALRLAGDMVASGRYRSVLVISADAVPEGAERFERFAIFGDAAASCVVTARDIAGYDILHAVHASGPASGESDIGGALAAEANRSIGAVSEGGVRAMKKVFHDNLFTPIVSMREQMAGFTKEQLYLNNIPAIGHCFACDPLVNLADYEARHGVRQGEHIGVFSGTPGIRAGAVLKKSAGPAE